MRSQYSIAAFILLLAAAALFYGFIFEPRRIVVENISVVLDDLPAELDGFQIIQLSDLELKDDNLNEHTRRVLAKINEIDADLIAITGDLIGNEADYSEAVEGAAAFAQSLQALHGVWIARGENDFTQPSIQNERFLHELPADDVKVLVNESVQVDGSNLYIAAADYMNFRPSWTTDFVVEQNRSERMLAAQWSQRPSLSHYIGDDAKAWQNYEFSGQFHHAQAGGHIGVVVYSQIPAGKHRYYLLGHEGKEYFVLRDSEGTRSASTGVAATPRTWYTFRVRVENKDGFTQVQAKLWPSRENEPDTWQAIIQDDADGRSTHGTVGVWSNKSGRKHFDDLVVNSLWLQGPDSGTTSTPSWFEDNPKIIYLEEDFSDYFLGQNPVDWLGYGDDNAALQAAVRNVPSEATVILLMHSVDFAKKAAAEEVDLMLSGGTHGGQVRLPLIGALYTGTEIGREFSSGLFRFGGTQVYVNRGIGTSIFPLRFLAPPEIAAIELKAREDSQNTR